MTFRGEASKIVIPFFLFIIVFVFRILSSTSELNFYFGDNSRDYLVSRHILQYGQVHLTGPDNQFGSHYTSPLYFYIYVVFLYFYNSLSTLIILNFFLSAIVSVFIFFIGRQVFNNYIGIISGVIYLLNIEVSYLSIGYWQPNLMQFVLYLGILCIVYGFYKKNFVFYLFSSALLAVSISLHHSAMGIAPIYGLLLVALCTKTLFKFKVKAVHLNKYSWYISKILLILTIALVFINVLLIVYLPTIYYVFSNNIRSFTDYYPKDYFISFDVLKSRFAALDKTFAFTKIIGLCGLVCVTLLIAKKTRRIIKKNTAFLKKTFLLFSVIFFYFLTTLLVPVNSKLEFPPRYFTPIMGLTCILLGIIVYIALIGLHYLFTTILRKVFKNSIIVLPIKVIFIFVVLYVYITAQSRSLISYFTTNIQKLYIGKYDFQVENPTVEYVAQMVQNIKNSKNYTDYNFFEVVSYNKFGVDAYSNEVIVEPLERKIGTKIVELSDDSLRDWRISNNTKYIFLRCPKDDNKCLKSFLKIHNTYTVIDTYIRSDLPYPIYLIEKPTL